MVDIIKFQKDQQQLSESEQQQGSTKRNLPQLLTSRMMDLLWEKMSRTYGNKWTSIAESDDGTWLDGLRGLTKQQLRAGYERCLSRYPDWPPTLPQFRQLCVDIDHRELDRRIMLSIMRDYGYDSYYINNVLPQREYRRLVESCRAEVEETLIDQTIARTAQSALLALEVQS